MTDGKGSGMFLFNLPGCLAKKLECSGPTKDDSGAGDGEING